jgi:hypothetical protein
MQTNYNDVFLNALNISPKDATLFGVEPSSTAASPNYNALLWKKIYTDRKMTSAGGDGGYTEQKGITDDGSFFVVATFNNTSTVKGNDIYNNLTIKKLSFDQYGNIQFGSTSWANPLFKPPKPSEATVYVSSGDLDRVVSSSGKWFLFRDKQISTTGNQIYYLLYNPIHSKAYNSYYNSIPVPVTTSSNKNIKDFSKRLADPLPQKYCEMMATKPNNSTKTSNIQYQQHWGDGFNIYDINGSGGPNSPGSDGHRYYADVLCNAIYNRECTNYSTGSQDPPGSQISVRGANIRVLDQNCDCLSDLREKSITKHEDSFISGFVQDSHAQKNGGDSECPKSLSITTCSQIINSAGSFNAKDSKFNQVCGSTPVDCSYNPVVWGGCDPLTGIQKGIKTVASLGFGGGRECEGPVGTIVPVTQPCIVNCEMTDWENSGTCATTSSICGSGPGLQSQIRKAKPETLPKNGGAACGSTQRDIPCTLPPCPTLAPTMAPTSAPTTASPATASPTTTSPTTASPATTSPTTSPTTAAVDVPSTSNNTTLILVALGAAFVGLGIYFYFAKKSTVAIARLK